MQINVITKNSDLQMQNNVITKNSDLQKKK